MFPSIASAKLTALCVSEKNGAHPKAIECLLSNNRISGQKTYITAGTDVEELLVLCKTEEVLNGRPLLKIAHLSYPMDQLEIKNFELDFMKDMKHGRLKLENVEINPEQILPGDGFADYAKPFRTLEDIFVGIAYHAMLLRQAVEYEWEEGLRDQLILQIFTLKQLINLPPSDPETLLILNSVEKRFELMLAEIENNIGLHASPGFKVDWEQNKKLIFMAKKLKEARLQRARKALFL